MVGALLALACWPANAAAAGPVRLTAGFEPGARLGESTEMHVALHVDTRRVQPPVTSLRLLYPRGIGLVTSGLGLASCVRPGTEFEQVLIERSVLADCPPNSVLGYGTANAEVRLLEGQVIPEFATLTLLSGAIGPTGLELVTYVVGHTPFGARLVYAGEVGAGSGSFGGTLTVRIPAIPSIADLATVALTDLRLSVGSPRIVYRRHVGHRSVRYHPDGVVLPVHCPEHGLRFRAVIGFEDHRRVMVDTTVPCTRVSPTAPRGLD